MLNACNSFTARNPLRYYTLSFVINFSKAKSK